MADIERLKARAAELPAKPGIYFFKSASGEVVYIGKARSLRDRVRSYFLANPDIKVRNILRETADIDYILTGSEKEAAFLENNYVQQHQPRFNLRLKDDKSFPYLKLTVGETWPGVYFSRKVEPDGSRYFGPFSPAGRARSSIHLVNKHFRVRGCEEAVFRNRKRPCLEYELGLCSAPCVGYISEADYRECADSACLFLEGRLPELARTLKARMERAAEEEKFEEAARWRDLLRTIEDYRDRPGAISDGPRGPGRRRPGPRGRSRGRLRLLHAQGQDPELGGPPSRRPGRPPGRRGPGRVPRPSFYKDRETPPRLLLPASPARLAGLQALLGWAKVRRPRAARRQEPQARRHGRPQRRGLPPRAGGRKPAPRRAEGRPSISPRSPARSRVSTSPTPAARSRSARSSSSATAGRTRTATGSSSSGPSRARTTWPAWRRSSPGDTASVLDGKVPLPDLVMVDGGKPQLGAAEKALSALGLSGFPLVSIAKKEEILFTPAAREGIRLDRTSPALKLIQAVRDETHRFAIAFHRGRREKRSFESLLDGIPGVGPKKKSTLLARYGSLEAIRNAPRDELDALVGAAVAARVLERLDSE